MIVLIMQLVAFYFRSGVLFRVASSVCFLIVVAVFIAGAVLMIVLVPLSDLCMDPSGLLQSLFSDDIADIVSYYTTCSGDNPLHDYVQSLNTYSAELETQLETLNVPYISSSQCYALLTSNYSSLASSVNSLGDLTDCSRTNSIYRDAVLSGLCGNGFTGLYNFWIVMYILAAFLFAGLCLSNLVYAHYNLALPSEQPTDPVEQEIEIVEIDARVASGVAYEEIQGTDHDLEAHPTIRKVPPSEVVEVEMVTRPQQL